MKGASGTLGSKRAELKLARAERGGTLTICSTVACTLLVIWQYLQISWWEGGGGYSTCMISEFEHQICADGLTGALSAFDQISSSWS